MAGRTRVEAAPPRVDSAYSVRAVHRVLDILDIVRTASDGVPFSEIAEAAMLPRSSVFRYLATLESRRYVVRDPASARYYLGPALLAYQSRRTDILVSQARPTLEALRDAFGETANLACMDGDHVLYLDIVDSPKAMRLSARVGDRDPLHSTALGKVIAARLDDDALRNALGTGDLAPDTERTITDPALLMKALGRVRKKGYAIDDGEHLVGARCVAVGVPIPHPIAAISISAPAIRLPLDHVDALVDALQAAARAIARRFEHAGAAER